MKKNVTTEITNIEQKVRNAQVELLYEQTKIGLIGGLIVALTACVIFWQYVPQWKLSIWTGLILLLTLLRGITIIAFQKRELLAATISQWANLHVLGVVVSGLLWSTPFVFLWPENTLLQVIWPICILPLSAAAVASYHTWAPSYIFFLVITAIPMSLRFFIEGGELFITLGLLTLFFIGVLLRSGKVMHMSSVRSFEFGIRNEALNIELNEVLLTREQLNKQLQEEVKEREFAENEIRKLSKVFLDGRNPTFIKDLNGSILEMNNEALRFYGFSRTELIGKSIKLLVPEQKHVIIEELIKRCLNGELVRDIEGVQRKKDGSEIPVLMTLSLLTNEENKPFGIASITSDITNQKNIEKELLLAKSVAESANASKDKFFKIISHDLKGPFSSIIGFSSLLKDKYDSFNDLKRKEFIQHINTSSNSVYNLLENLLTWARTQTDEIRINKEKLYLKELVNTSIATSMLNANSKNISIINTIQPELVILIDKNTALTFIRNIVNNAIKFTHNGGKITINANVHNASIVLYIADTGIGMSSEVIDNLFKIDKSESTRGTNNEEGTGLGLIMCKEFIERNGGSISVKSNVNKGSEFIIVLPQ